MNKATEWQCSETEYHKDRVRIGRSGAWTFLQGRRLYEAQYLLGTVTDDETKSTRLGSVVDILLLQPSLEQDLVRVGPTKTRTAKAWIDWAKDQPSDTYLVTRAEIDCARRMVEAIQKHPRAREILDSPGRLPAQSTVVWEDERTGLLCKCRRDIVIPMCVVDLKTDRDPRPDSFARVAADRGYHFQGAWYTEAEARRLGCDPDEILFLDLVVRNEQPHEVVVYELPEEPWLELGRRQMREALDGIAECLASGDWRDRWEIEQTELPAPSWITAMADSPIAITSGGRALEVG